MYPVLQVNASLSELFPIKDAPCTIADECSDMGASAPEWSEEVDSQTMESKSAAADAFSNGVRFDHASGIR